MAEVSIKVGGRHYQMACDDGQEAHLRMLAGRIDEEAQAMIGGGNISEARLLLMSALMLADQLDEAEEALRAASVAVQPAESGISAAGEGTLFDAMGGDGADILYDIDAATARITALTGPASTPPGGTRPSLSDPIETKMDGSDREDISQPEEKGPKASQTPFERRAERRARRAARN